MAISLFVHVRMEISQPPAPFPCGHSLPFFSRRRRPPRICVKLFVSAANTLSSVQSVPSVAIFWCSRAHTSPWCWKRTFEVDVSKALCWAESGETKKRPEAACTRHSPGLPSLRHGSEATAHPFICVHLCHLWLTFADAPPRSSTFA